MKPRTGLLPRMLALAVTTITAAAGAVMAPNPAAAAPPGGQTGPRALVIQLTWEAGNGTPASPVDRPISEVLAAFDSHRAWMHSASRGTFSGWHTSGTGPITIPPPRMVGGICTNAIIDDIRSAADKAVVEQSPVTDVGNYDLVVYYFSKIQLCGWPARGSSSGHIWLNGAINLGLVAHEMGHVLGRPDADGLRCHDVNGNVMPLSNSCEVEGYGDMFSALGGGYTGTYSAMEQFKMGWLSGRMADVPIGGGVFSLLALEKSDWGLQALRLVDGNATLWVEYRQPIGVDAGIPSFQLGVFIHLEMPGSKSRMLDMTPQTADSFFDVKLPVGATWLNPLGTMKITVNSAGLAAAQITIESQFAQVPNVIGYTLSQATAAITAAGFTRGTVSFAIDDTCNNIGRVKTQTPSAGTRHPAGTAVRLTIGSAPAHPCP